MGEIPKNSGTANAAWRGTNEECRAADQAQAASQPQVSAPSNGEISAPERSSVCPRKTLVFPESAIRNPQSAIHFPATMSQPLWQKAFPF